jgi:cytochrome c peroxidase/DNA-binding beta-propeller fold protein YncE
VSGGPGRVRAYVAILVLAAGVLVGCGSDSGVPTVGVDLGPADAAEDARLGANDGVDDDADADAPDVGMPADAADTDEMDAGDDADCDTPVALPDRLPETVLVGAPLSLRAPADGRLEAGLVEDGDARETDDGLELTFRATGRKRVEVLLFHTCDDRFVASRIYSLAVLDEAPAPRRSQSSSVAFSEDGTQLAVVSEDAGSIVLLSPSAAGGLVWASAPTASEATHIPVCSAPAQLAWRGDTIAVTCPDTDQIALVDAGSRTLRGVHTFAWGERPWGIAGRDDGWWVTLQGAGAAVWLDEVVDPGQTLRERQRFPVTPDARAIADVGDGTLLVTRWRATNTGNAVVRLDPTDGSVQAIALPRIDVLSSDTETGGVPTFVQSVVVSNREPRAYVVGVLSNIGEGLRRSGEPLVQDTTLRAVLLTLDLDEGVERTELREVFDDRGYGAAIALSAASDFAYIAMRGARTVERYDLLTSTEAGSQVDVGFAPHGLAVEPTTRTLVVDVSLSRQLASYDAGAWSGVDGGEPRWRVPTVVEEPLPPAVLEGKRLFNDSADPRLTQDAYIACAHCHLEGDHDGLTWDFSDRGEGLRDTISLLGRAGMGHGLLHWSANFNEVQDFEHDLRGPFGGRGLMDDAAYADGRDTPFGADKAGASEPLDALAAYVSSLSRYRRSPFRAADGSLTAAAQRGRVLFGSEELGCTSCHSGAALTDSGLLPSGAPRVHDVGTLARDSGERLGGPLRGIDTPTLHGVFDGAPYLHDGSAATLRDVLVTRNPDDRHGRTSQLDATELDDLVAYLLSLDGRRD